MSTVGSKDSSSSSSSGSEYSSSEGSSSDSDSSSSGYSDDSSEETDSEESDSENVPQRNEVDKHLPDKLESKRDGLPPWQATTVTASSSNIEDEGRRDCGIPATELSAQPPRNEHTTPSSQQKSVTFQEHTSGTKAIEETSDTQRKAVSSKDSEKARVCHFSTSAVPPPEEKHCTTDLSMDVGQKEPKSKSRNTEGDTKGSDTVSVIPHTDDKLLKRPDVTTNPGLNEPAAVAQPPSISGDKSTKPSSEIINVATGARGGGMKTSVKRQGDKNPVADIIDETNEVKDDVLLSKTRGVGSPIKMADSDVSSLEDSEEVKAGSSAASQTAVEQFCFCKGEEYGLMIQCENCSEWYHDECLELTTKEISSIEIFYCTICISANDKLAIVYKKGGDLDSASECLNEALAKDMTKDPAKNIPPPLTENITAVTSADTAPDLGSSALQVKLAQVAAKHQESKMNIPESEVPADDKGSSDEEWLDIANEKDSKSKTSATEPCVNFIARTKEMLAKKPLESEKKELLLPVTSPMDLKRNEYWDENFYKPHINEDLSSCFSQMSIDWESARKIFCHSTISPLKGVGKEKTNSTKQATKTPLKGSAQNTRRELPLTEATTPTRESRFVPTPADPEVMKIFERSLLVSPCKKVVRPKDKPSRRLSLVKLDDKVTMNFGKSPSPVTAREMGKKLFSGKHDWNSHNSNEKENSSPKTPRKVQKSKAARKPLFADKPIDPAWAKGLEEIKGDYPFYSLKNNQLSQQTSTADAKETNKVAEKQTEQDLEIGAERQNATKVSTTPKKSKVDDSHLFKTPTKSVRRMRKKSISSDRQSEGWSPGAKLLEHSCPYDPSESGCYSQTIDSQTPIKVPLAPSLDSIIKSKPVSSHTNEISDKDERAISNTPRAKKSLIIENDSVDLSRSFDIEFDDLPEKSPVKSSQSNVTVKTILPKLLCHLEKAPPSPQEPLSESTSENMPSKIEKDHHTDITKESCLSQKTSIDEKSAECIETGSPSKCMKDVPSFIEAPVEDTLDFEENVASPATSSKKVLIGYGSEFCDEGEVFSSDDDECILYNNVREAQRNALFDSSEPNSEVTETSLNQEIEAAMTSKIESRRDEEKMKVTLKDTNSKLLSDKEFLEQNKMKYVSDKSLIKYVPEEQNDEESSNEIAKESLPFTFKPIATCSSSAPIEKKTSDVRKPIASTPKKSVRERCDTPLSALNDDEGETDRKVALSAISKPSTRSEMPPKMSHQDEEEQPRKSTMSSTSKNCDRSRGDTSLDANSEPVSHCQEMSTQRCTTDLNQILRSCESLSNPSVDRASPLTANKEVDAPFRREVSSLSVTESIDKNDIPEVSQFLTSDEKLADFMPARSIHSAEIVKTPLSAAVVRTGDEGHVTVMQTDVGPVEGSQHEEVGTKEVAPTVNFLLSSEETMSNWTPEPSPTETPSSDPLNSLPAKRRVSLHDYVIRKEAISKTPTLPECSFSTPDFAKSKESNLGRTDLGRPESPLAVEHDSPNLETTQSPVPMEHGLLPKTTGNSLKRRELVPKLKYHHLIPIHIPPREFLYCKRVKVIQNMLINELIGGVDFNNHQPITKPLHGTRAESHESDDHQEKPRRRSETVKSLDSIEAHFSEQSVAKQPAALQLQSDSAMSSKTPVSSDIVVPLQHALVTPVPNPNTQTLNASNLNEVTETSGMDNPSILDEESHDYFRNVKIPKVKRVTDSFMSDSSVLNSYDCGPDTITVGQIIQQSMVSDVSSVGLDSMNRPSTSFSSSTVASAGIPTRDVSDMGSTGQDVEPSVCPLSTPKISENSNDVEKVNSYVKQCLFSDEGISRSPIIPSHSNLTRANSTPNLNRQKTSFTITHPSQLSTSFGDEYPSQTTPKSRNLKPDSVHEEAHASAASQSFPLSSVDPKTDVVIPIPTIPDEKGADKILQKSSTVELVSTLSETVGPLSELAKSKPPKFKIPKKKKPSTAPPSSTSSDPLLTSPRKIKQFISSSASTEPPQASTLFTLRKKKQLDEIVSQERAVREQVLQDYREKEQIDVTSAPIEESVKPSLTRKRRKTDSPEVPQTFDLRNVLSSKSAAKPECKRSKRRSAERKKSNDSETERRRSERSVRDSDDKKRGKERRVNDPQLCFKSKLFDALAVLNTRERDLKIPDKMAGKHSSLSLWLESWKDDEVRLKELRTARLKIRDPDYKPRDLSKLVLTKVPVPLIRKTKPKAPEKEMQESSAKAECSEGVFGWKDAKPDPCHANFFPTQQSESSIQIDTNAGEASFTSASNPLLNKSNPLTKKSNPLLRNKTESSSASSVPAPKVWTECMKRADAAHYNPKQIRKKTVIDIMTTKEVGPLSTLQRALTTNLKVTVVTRTFKGVRGECTGYLVAYDKYMNLALSDVTEHYRSLYHKLPDPNKAELPSNPPTTSTNKFQTDSSFMDFKRSVTVSFDRDMLREIKSPSQSPERSGAGGREVKIESLDFISLRSGGGDARSPGASIRSPSLSPPPSENSSPAKIQTADEKQARTLPGLLGWARMTPEHRKFKYTKNCITTRHCKQVFLRGDNVVLVRLVE